jgi:hypothetical protein
VLQDPFKRAYVAQYELRQIVRQDVFPEDVVSQLIREGSLQAMSTVWAVLGDDEAVREQLAAGRHRDACGCP